MDKIDRKLLRLLQEDASRTNAQLADLVALSPSSCLRRIRKLKKAGMIDGVVAVLNASKVGKGIKAIITVELARHDEQNRKRFLDLAARESAVTQAYSVTGQIDAILTMQIADMEELTEACARIFDESSNVTRYYTMIVKRTGKDTTAVPI